MGHVLCAREGCIDMKAAGPPLMSSSSCREMRMWGLEEGKPSLGAATVRSAGVEGD